MTLALGTLCVCTKHIWLRNSDNASLHVEEGTLAIVIDTYIIHELHDIRVMTAKGAGWALEDRFQAMA